MRSVPNIIISMLILIANNYRLTESFGLDMIGNIQTTFNFFNDAYGVIQGDLPITSLLSGSTGVMLDKIMDSVGAISGQIDDLSASFTAQLRASDAHNAKQFNAIQAGIERIIEEVPLKGKLHEDMREFRSYVTRVNSLYKEFEYYSKNKTNFNEQTIHYFIESIISRNHADLFDTLQQLYNLIVEEDWYSTEGIMQLYAHSLRTTDTEKLCGSGLSPQGRFFKMYESIYMAEARGFMMQMFAFSVKSAYTRTSYIGELDLAKQMMFSRLEKYYFVATNQMKGLAQIVQQCDAPKYISDINYVEIGEFDMADYKKSNSNSWISLSPRKANVDENMVVSGVRFVKRPDGMIDYQIKEAKLLPFGQVAQNGTWKELPEITPVERETFIPIDPNTMISTDDVHFNSEYVVVGVDLEYGMAPVNGGVLINLQLCGMKFNVNTGQLKPGSETWKFLPGDTSKKLEQPKAVGQGDPERADRNVIDSKSNQQYLFMITKGSSKHKHVIPYFDARPVETSLPNLALAGLGIYHRGAPGFGGFFNFRLFTVDMDGYVKNQDATNTA